MGRYSHVPFIGQFARVIVDVDLNTFFSQTFQIHVTQAAWISLAARTSQDNYTICAI
jgi:hypothetical protein